MNNNEYIALLLTCIAGLSTGIGSFLALYKKPSDKILASGMGLSAGVMIYISLAKLLVESEKHFEIIESSYTSEILTSMSFIGGMAIVFLINKFISFNKNPHQMFGFEKGTDKQQKILRTGILTAIILSIHNFPEGLATYASSVYNIELGINITFAIALHNIPEGLAVAIPIYYATNNKTKAFIFSFLPGMTEPIGGLLGYFFLTNMFNDFSFGIIMASVAGIMVFISFDQLIPAAIKTKEYMATVYGIILGIILMQFSLNFHFH